ncbi:MAG TPA: SAM-dependent methyltransferase [Gemmatimonadales bacterium]|jgi:methyltransferase (TIGR00027 family)
MTQVNPIRNVSDTALWVAIYRAMESERPDAIFKDPYARRLGGERGEAIVRSMPRGASFAWPMIVRTAVMDELITTCIAKGARTVLNLAAGLDSRPWRMMLPATLRWIHVDMPDMIDYMKDRMAGETPRCRLEYVAADLRDGAARRSLFAGAAAEGPVLVITEGLLIYLTAEQVASLAAELHDIAKAKWWISDLASPMLLKFLAKRWQPKLQEGNAPMQFAPAEGTAFFAPHGWKENQFRSTWDESKRLKRTMKGAWFWGLFTIFQSKQKREEGRRMAGVILLDGV